ncbi:hypothetical protein BOTBODRAFT_54016 [Botryobasidium botryosum FD-172 SS1]|uniref:AMP-dependent synthetase/ligase domain-containing protein n=1 Tax=Botryobasidium botryosum (strain FD-172 SS1) TaxID=930990 RepID=A0A067MYF1_BOTB1|nr:hypothetical protein BOTBODRAFT_54016 [Botryobasidium botryosum FD-172 SS1]
MAPGMLINPASIASLSPKDQRLFLRFGAGAVTASPFECIHHAFEYHAAARPDAIAVGHLSESITYAELDSKANRLAHRLRALGICPGKRVCLLVQRSVHMVVGIMAVLKAGGQYIPLDGAIATQSTLEYVLENSKCSVVLTLRRFASRVPISAAQDEGRHTCLTLEDAIEADIDEGLYIDKPADLVRGSDGIYVIYTSGTTGKPKGVDVAHSSVVNLVCMNPGSIGMRPGLRVAQLLNVAFDMCAWEVLGSLANGCTLVIRGSDWPAVLRAVDVVICTPTILGAHDPADYPNIKYVATAGEPCPQSLADKWSRTGEIQTVFHNSCGPTETTIVNTIQPHTRGAVLSIGVPTPNNTVYILDEEMRPVPIGQVGVMWAGGAGIARGYVGLPQLTAKSFKRDPFLDDGRVMFNTGDIGRWREDGQLEHLGRADDQVKVKGFRVELDGVSAAMEKCAGVDLAATLLIHNRLVGFFSPSQTDSLKVKETVASIQPYYAVPSRFIALDEFPRTANGKIDKKALRALAEAKTAHDDSGKAPYANSGPLSTYSDPHGTPSPPSTALSNTSSKAPESTLGSFQTLPAASTHNEKPLLFEVTKKVQEDLPAPWEDFDALELPEKTQGKWARNLRHQVFTLYRRLFSFVFIANMAIFISFLARGSNAGHIATAVTANLLCSVLMRQDHVINLFFTVCTAAPPTWPLFIRRVLARVYHIGGWLPSCGLGTLPCKSISVATVVVTYLILLLLISIVLFAYPPFRIVKHDSFEMIHRFAGWTATALTWALIILLTNDLRSHGQSLGNALLHNSSVWMLAVLTASIILPWTKLRKVPVRAEVLSHHAVRLYFDYATPVPGAFTRISESPLFEWHSFAVVEPGVKGYNLVVSKAGDWTSKQIAEPPTHLWVRGVPTCGVLRIVPLFSRILFIATGSGIGPCAGPLFARKGQYRLLWTSPDVRKTFGDKLVDAILDAEPNAVIYDTRKRGKPDMVKLAYRLVDEFKPEAVCIISNQKLTRKVVYGMMSRGVPAFGAIWDS